MTFYSAIFPFTDLSTDFFHDKWGLPEASGEGLGFLQAVFYNITHMFQTAQGTTSIIITASMLLAPFAGRLVDRVGRRATFMIFGSLLMIPAHLVLGWTMIPPAYAMIVLGAAFVLVPAAMWPAIPLVVEKERVGTAFFYGRIAAGFVVAHFFDALFDFAHAGQIFVELGFVLRGIVTFRVGALTAGKPIFADRNR